MVPHFCSRSSAGNLLGWIHGRSGGEYDVYYNYLVFFLPMYLYRMMVLSVSKKADHIRKEHRSQMMT